MTTKTAGRRTRVGRAIRKKVETGCYLTNRFPATGQLRSGFWLSAVAAVVLAFLCFVVEEAAHTAAGAGTAFLRLRL